MYNDRIFAPFISTIGHWLRRNIRLKKRS